MLYATAPPIGPAQRMSPDLRLRLQKGAIIIVALPALLWFPFGLSLVITSGKQVLFGFDDYPVGPLLLSLVFGSLMALGALVVVGSCLWKGDLRVPLAVAALAAVFGILSVPASRLMTGLVERRLHRLESPSQSGDRDIDLDLSSYLRRLRSVASNSMYRQL